jgi:hypothetical protein
MDMLNWCWRLLGLLGAVLNSKQIRVCLATVKVHCYAAY